MGKLNLNYDKTLKLTNVVIKEVAEEDFDDMSLTVEKLENYIKSKGYTPISPLIQYSRMKTNGNGEIDIVIKLIRQSSNYINHSDEQYKCESILRIKTVCMCVI